MKMKTKTENFINTIIFHEPYNKTHTDIVAIKKFVTRLSGSVDVEPWELHKVLCEAADKLMPEYNAPDWRMGWSPECYFCPLGRLFKRASLHPEDACDKWKPKGAPGPFGEWFNFSTAQREKWATCAVDAIVSFYRIKKR